ncbi:MAG: mdoG [Deltaproteobacteria bacterium]|nr:mdoG [Deltaproteobacteria bacterium]
MTRMEIDDALRRMRFSWWPCVRTLVLLGLIGASMPVAGARAFTLDDVVVKAEQLAREPFAVPQGQVPDWLLKIDYDQWRDIRFRPQRSLWRDAQLPFQLQFFHPGLYYDRTVAINVIDAQGVRPVAFSTDQFDYGKNKFAKKIPRNLGYAGFRIHYPLNKPDYLDELIVFVGASYFRSLGRNQVYGLSARGIAIDTIAATKEEFPYFREFWLERPAPDAKTLQMYALLDGPSVTGAYRFTIEPGDETIVRVEMKVFLRRPVEKLGIAPLTSMFFHGENTLHPFVDFRPEVHDSDGLLLHFNTGEWLWRPLDNPQSLQVNTLQMHQPKGFGLIQRDRNFDHHQDMETRTDLRPSVWISTDGDWGDGSVELVQIPTNTDVHDNVVAYWVPREQPKPGEPLAFAYTMYWHGDDTTRPPGGRVVSTRRDWGMVPNANRFVLDFDGGALRALGADQAPRGVVSIAGGAAAAELLDQHVVKNPVNGSWRLTFQIRPKQTTPIELRAFLENNGQALTETWSYAASPW